MRVSGNGKKPHRPGLWLTKRLFLLLVMCAGLVFAAFPAGANDRLGELLKAKNITPADLVPGADRLGAAEGAPPVMPAYQGTRLVGYVFLNSDFVNTTGYSGKPIHVLVGMDPGGTVVGAKMVQHSEPIVLIGIPEAKVVGFINGYIGRKVSDLAAAALKGPPVDIISGATVTVVVIGDSITRAGLKVLRQRATAAGGAAVAEAPRIKKSIDPTRDGRVDWTTLLGDGSVRRLALSLGEVNESFVRSGNRLAAERPEPGDAAESFIDLYVGLATVPGIGRSLLGDAEYQNMLERLKPGQQAILVMANGRYSFKGSGYVRGGIFDRFELVQDDNSIRFHDRNHKRLGSVAAEGAPAFSELGLFFIPEGATLDPTEPWRLQLLVARATGPLDKAFFNADLTYTTPPHYLKSEPLPAAVPLASASAPASAPASVAAGEGSEAAAEPVWVRLWRSRTADLAVLGVALGVLTLAFFFQNSLAARPQLLDRFRLAYLAFVLVWLGWLNNAQLSVVNVFTFINALISNFQWDYFLMDPLVFVLWAAVAISLLFWGRGAFCGWLCPFGALQEFISRIAKLLHIPQWTLPWGLNERLWPVKYILFIGLFGLSLHSMTMAETLAEVEPFKTGIILKFQRDWPFVLYALTLLAAGLFVERFFCRYLCPLGAALAIPGRLRMFEWLKRYRDCGHPCQRCSRECCVAAIHPEGHINPNECIYCLHCQALYRDAHKCPVMVQRRLKYERRQAVTGISEMPPAMAAGRGTAGAPLSGDGAAPRAPHPEGA